MGVWGREFDPVLHPEEVGNQPDELFSMAMALVAREDPEQISALAPVIMSAIPAAS